MGRLCSVGSRQCCLVQSGMVEGMLKWGSGLGGYNKTGWRFCRVADMPFFLVFVFWYYGGALARGVAF